jgi:hypothetical protein
MDREQRIWKLVSTGTKGRMKLEGVSVDGDAITCTARSVRRYANMVDGHI